MGAWNLYKRRETNIETWRGQILLDLKPSLSRLYTDDKMRTLLCLMLLVVAANARYVSIDRSPYKGGYLLITLLITAGIY